MVKRNDTQASESSAKQQNPNADAGQPKRQSNEDNQQSTKQEYKLDKLMGPNLKTEHTGSALVVARTQRFHTSTVEAHVNEIYPLLKSLEEYKEYL